MIVGFGCVIGLYFKPHLAKVLGPIYALAQGFFVGAISKAYETLYNGIVVQAAGATLAVFAVMLLLYRTRIIKVTDRFRRIVIFATLGVMALYLVSFVISLFGARDPVHQRALGVRHRLQHLRLRPGGVEPGARLRLHRARRRRPAWPRTTSGYAAFGLLVTIVWLYLEILRLLAKLRQN